MLPRSPWLNLSILFGPETEREAKLLLHHTITTASVVVVWCGHYYFCNKVLPCYCLHHQLSASITVVITRVVMVNLLKLLLKLVKNDYTFYSIQFFLHLNLLSKNYSFMSFNFFFVYCGLNMLLFRFWFDADFKF